MSTNLSPEQARALRVAQQVLAHDKDTTTPARRVGRLREALAMVVGAFAEDES